LNRNGNKAFLKNVLDIKTLGLKNAATGLPKNWNLGGSSLLSAGE